MTKPSPSIRIRPRRQPLIPIKIAENIIVVTVLGKHTSTASAMEVFRPMIVRSRIDSTTRGLGRGTLTDLRLVSGGRRHGRIAVVEQAA